MQVWQPTNLTEICRATPSIPACSNFGLAYFGLLVQLYGGSADKEKQDLCDIENKAYTKDGEEYDFIVVGAGSAGCIIANRLTQNPKWKVLLLEAGPEEPDITGVPGLMPTMFGSNIDWKYSTEPNGKSCLAFGGRCGWPRGKTMGGSTSTNGMAYVRGNRVDYDWWSFMGNKGWSYNEVMPFFLKSEKNMNKYVLESEYHGAKGEQSVSWLPYVDDIANMLVEAFTERGIPFGDYNGGEQLRTMQAQAFSLDGERVSANSAFIKPIRHQRPNLVVKTNSEAVKILIDNYTNAYGIVYNEGGKKYYYAYARKEVIISAGTINSAKLLMLSGIGPQEHLKNLNIPVVRNLAVGENLHEHVSLDGIIIALSNKSSTAISEENVLSAIKEYNRMKIKKGPLSGLGPSLSSSFYKTEPFLLASDIQYQATPVANWRKYLEDPLQRENVVPLPSSFYDAIMPRPMNLVPLSRGKLLLNRNNPHGHPELHANYLGDDRDLIPLLKGIRFLLTLENTAAFQSRGAHFVRERMPHCQQYVWGTDEYFVCLIKYYTSSTHHQVGTCKMGPQWDSAAVVDGELRVYGVRWLRVIDASVMPVVIRGNTNAPTMMIAEKGVDSVINYWKNRTKNYCF